MALPAKLSETTQAHLDRLVAEGATEGQHLDFKRELPTNWDDKAKARFLADITAFANASGGDLVYGVDEDKDARAVALVPQMFSSVDGEVMRLQDFMLNQVEPRTQGVQVHSVAVTVGSSTGHAIIVRVPQSWAGPHRSKVNNHFYVRDGVRNRQLDVPEIRALILRADGQAQRMRSFRGERLAKVLTGQTPVPLTSAPKLVVHAISTQAALGQTYIDPVSYAQRRRPLPVLGDSSANGVGLNLDGAYGEIPSAARGKRGYTQQFRQGYFEAVWELMPLDDVTDPVLPSIAYERFINSFLESVRSEFAAHDVSSEMAVFVSLTNANLVQMTGPSDLGRGFGGHSLKRFDRSDVLLPDVLVEPDVSIGRGMRPAYDLMCQAAGYEGSDNYGDDGEWNRGR